MIKKKIICLAAIAFLALVISSVYADPSGSNTGSKISPVPTPTPEPQQVSSQASVNNYGNENQHNNVQNDKKSQGYSKIITTDPTKLPNSNDSTDQFPNKDITKDPRDKENGEKIVDPVNGNKSPDQDRNKYPYNLDHRYLYGSGSTSSSSDSSGTGTLYVSSSPGGASVYVDGSYSGVTPAQGSLAVTGLSTGSHEVQVTAPGYGDYSTSVNIQADESSFVHATLSSV